MSNTTWKQQYMIYTAQKALHHTLEDSIMYFHHGTRGYPGEELLPTDFVRVSGFIELCVHK